MSDFEGDSPIRLQPKSKDINHGFTVEVKASATAKKGWLAYGTTISGIDVTAYKTADIDNRSLVGGQITVDDLIQGTPLVNDNVMTVKMSYPSTNGEGYYKLTFHLTIDDSSEDELDFEPIIVEER